MLATLAILIAAWFIGYLTNGVDIAPFVREVIPGAARVETAGDIYIGYGNEGSQILGYAATGSAPGYSGPIEVLVGIDAQGSITGVKVIQHRETPGFFRLIINAEYLSDFIDKQFNSSFSIGEDIDAVSGATLSAEGIAASARQAVRKIADQGLEQPLPPERRAIKFGVPEVVLICLFGIAYIGHRLRSSRWKKTIRWGTLITGMLVLGFIYTSPLTITMIVSLISGYWPDWHNNLYWYLLIGGILFVTTVDAKNPYCSWFCPFGAVQECLGTITKAKLYRPRELHDMLKWLQRGLTLAAIVLGLSLRRPGAAGYEPFATLFNFQGDWIEWALLGLVLFASLITYRPFCNYLCPLDPVVDYIGAGRKWARQVIRKWKPQAKRS